jgi:hypothetical protein
MGDAKGALDDAVDWAEVDAALKSVPADYREPRFHPLKHVVDIFSSSDPQGQTQEVGSLHVRLPWRQQGRHKGPSSPSVGPIVALGLLPAR